MQLLQPRIVLGVALVIGVFLLISLAQEMNRRLQVQREVRRLEQEVQEMQKTVTHLENLNQYFRTDAYQERLAREKLNYKAEGEQVILIPENATPHDQAVATSETADTVSIPEKWWRIFFVPEYGG